MSRSAEQSKSIHRAMLRERIRRNFDIVDRDIIIGEWTISFTQICDPDAVLDQIVDEADRREKLKGMIRDEDELHLPYWAELWDSAIGVGHWLIEDSKFRVEGSTLQHRGLGSSTLPLPTMDPLAVLDLGCGMGLAGTVATMLGHRVLFGDIEKPCLLFARYNAMRFDPRVRARRIDWKKDRLGERFNLVIGSDVLYDKTQWEFLVPFFEAHLEPNGKIILGEPGRQTGEMFVEWLRQRGGWALERSSVKVATRDTPIKLFLLHKNA